MNPPKHSCVKQEITQDINFPVLISPADNVGERGKNKMGANIFLFVVFCYLVLSFYNGVQVQKKSI